MRIRIGTRSSALARWQTEHVAARLAALASAPHVETIPIQTTGDRITDVPLARIGDIGLFTRQLDVAVLDGEVDMAVHSLKDVPTRLEPGLRLAAVLERDDPRDAFVPAPGAPSTLAALPAGARIGTSSLRRRALLRQHRPDLEVVDLRGNIDTRLARLATHGPAAAVLAMAGLRRLGRHDVVGQLLEPPDWLPAPGQGALAVVTRDEDTAIARLVATLDHAPTRAAVTAERSFLRRLEGGCQIPIGALAEAAGETLTLHGFAADDESGAAVRGRLAGSCADAAALGERLADELIAAGADAILETVRRRGRPLPSASAP